MMGLNLDDLQPTKNTSNRVADAVRAAILQGKIKVGDALRQDVIAAELEVSKIPVREALVQLQAEGLVDLIPSRGAIVRGLSAHEIAEVYEMRLALEPLALRKAVPNLRESDLMDIDYLLGRIDRATDWTRWAELNWEFHEALYRSSGMNLLIQTAKFLHNNVTRFIAPTHLNQDYLKNSQQQHRRIVEHCREGNVDAACIELIHHLGDAKSTIESKSD
jgi:DNA-binding GntR family transcriptional regulator